MKILIIALLQCLALQVLATQTTDAPAKAVPGQYVAINIEIKELEESGKILKEATQKLAQTLDQTSDNLDELSPEQLVLINSLADKVDGIAQQLNTTMTSLPKAIKDAQQPTAELLQGALIQVREETIEPITSKIEGWFLILLIGLGTLGAGLLGIVYYCLRQFRSVGDSIKSIAEGYRIVPLEQYEKGLSDD